MSNYCQSQSEVSFESLDTQPNLEYPDTFTQFKELEPIAEEKVEEITDNQ